MPKKTPEPVTKQTYTVFERQVATLDARQKFNGVNKSFIVRKALDEYFERYPLTLKKKNRVRKRGEPLE